MNTIKLYNTEITPSRNLQVDNISGYLSTLTSLYTKENAGFMRIDLDVDYKLDVPQELIEGVTSGNPNYLVYTKTQDDKTFTYYFFIISLTQVNPHTISFELSIDSINTFQGLFTFGKKTQITRQMRDRFVKPTDERTQVLDMPFNVSGANYLNITTEGNTLTLDSEEETLPEIVDYVVYTGTLSEGVYKIDYTSLSQAYIEVYIDGVKVAKGSTITLTKKSEIEIDFNAQKYSVFTEETITINVNFLSHSNYALRRRIDMQPEGIDVEKYLIENTKLLDSSTLSSNKWFLIYQTATELSTENLDNPVSCYLLSNCPVQVELALAPSVEVDFSEIMVGGYLGGNLELIYFNDTNGEVNITFNGTTNNIIIGATSLSTGSKYFGTFPTKSGVIAEIGIGWANYVGDLIYLYANNSSGELLWTSTSQSANTDNMLWEFINSLGYYHQKFLSGADFIALITHPSSDVVTTIKSLSDQSVYQNNSKTMKIIEVPYAPDTPLHKRSNDTYSFSDWYVSTQGAFKSKKHIPDLERLNATSFEVPELFVNIPEKVMIENGTLITHIIPRNNIYESKLYSKELYSVILRYDSFEKMIPLELINDSFNGYYDSDYSPLYYVDMKVTNTINSAFVFKIRSNDLDIAWAELYDEFMLVKRNNEQPIYSNAYVDYVKSGYRYDLKANTLSERQRWLTTGVNIIGAGVSLGVSAATGSLVSAAAGISFATSAINSISANITSTTQADNAMASKLATLKNQASAVSGSDDIDLFNYYNGGDKLRLIRESVRPELKEAIADLFYYTGYGCTIQGIPNTHSRLYFDYVQCSPDFDDDNKYVYNDYMADIKSRYEAGVTIMHDVDGYYNWAQDRENWEIWI